MYQRLGYFVSSNAYIQNYKNKDILNIYRKISEGKHTKTNTLLKTYDITDTLEIRVE